ncbi:MAG: tetraacyldisaccharide 4'-kinase [Bacteroidales bacterium]|nr:tetraacyldisaccharide 4'-kinase [Bacteroidales bacterium]
MIDKFLLFPYYWVLKARNRRWNRPGRKLSYAEVPTLCIGNVTVGGTGKTPHVEMVLRLLQQHPDWCDKQLAVLSRGYKRDSQGFQQVTSEGSAVMYGDEPMQIKKKFPDVVVAVDKKRERGCDLLVHPEKLQERKWAKKCWNREFKPADYIVLDDAFQYRRLKTHKSVVLVDYNRPVQKDMLLPLGRLRDLPERIYEADALIVTKCPAELDAAERAAFVRDLGFTDYLPSACEATNPKGRRQQIFFTTVQYASAEGVFPTAEPRYVYSKKAILVTGIAGDAPFRAFLSDTYKICDRFRFPDHHRYVWKDITRIQNAVNRQPLAAVITTEKDAQRLLDCTGMPQALKERLFKIPISAEFLTEEERTMFTEFITEV